MSVENEGSMTFWLSHEHDDWHSNSNGYNFNSFSGNGLTVTVVKQPDCRLDLAVKGPMGQTFSFRVPVPECPENRLFVCLTWKHPEFNLYLNSQHIDTITV